METTLKNLLIEQTIQFHQLKRVLINFKKLSKANLTLPKTEGRLTDLEKLWEKCEALHVRISQTVTEEEMESIPYFTKEEFLDAEDVYIEAADHIQDALSKLRGNNQLPAGRGNESLFRDSPGGSVMQLPRIGLPKFSGKATEWENFRGMYESLLLQSDVLTNVQKLHYLKNSLEGEAALLISTILKCCFNCLKPGHFSKTCKGKPGCNRCRRAHHSFLHQESVRASNTNSQDRTTSTSPPNVSDSSVLSSGVELGTSASVQSVFPPSEPERVASPVLLATAWVSVSTAEGRVFHLRALLDQGSTYSFISESHCQTMRVKRRRANLRIHCFGETFGGVVRSCVDLVLAATTGRGPSFPFTGYVHQCITAYAASRARPTEVWPHLKDLPLADPDYKNNHQIHVLIGADLYGSLLLNDLRQGPLGTPTAQLTIFGWILSGPAGKGSSEEETVPALHCMVCEDTNLLLKQFWEDEGLPTSPPITEEDEMC